MSIQYRDGTFSDNMELPEAMEEFMESAIDGTARALFVGTERELDLIKKEKSISEEIKALEDRVNNLESADVSSDVVVIPTRDEMIRALRKY